MSHFTLKRHYLLNISYLHDMLSLVSWHWYFVTYICLEKILFTLVYFCFFMSAGIAGSNKYDGWLVLSKISFFFCTSEYTIRSVFEVPFCCFNMAYYVGVRIPENWYCKPHVVCQWHNILLFHRKICCSLFLLQYML
jgi:hypothetical protein